MKKYNKPNNKKVKEMDKYIELEINLKNKKTIKLTEITRFILVILRGNRKTNSSDKGINIVILIM